MSSCAWFTQRRTLFGGGDDEKELVKATSQSVSKEQYDALLSKYEKLQERVNNGNTGNAKDMSIINDLQSSKGNSQLADTVDVFSKGGATTQSFNSNALDMAPVDEGYVLEINDEDARELESEIFELSKSVRLMDSRQFADAMGILNQLRQSKFRQIRVRAQFNIGEILFAQNEYDLAMQAFEDIVRRQAFSGFVLKSLGRLIACSEKLNLKEKQDQYYSILHDFFESA